MPRRNDHTRSEIREMIINAGQDIIQESGISALSTRKIASRIGYTVGTLYHFFDNYDDVVLHINAVTIKDLRNHFLNKTNQNLEGCELIQQLADIYLDFLKTNHHRWSALFEYKLSNNIELPQWYKEKIDNLFELIEQPLLSIIKDKSLAQKHSKILWASIHGICSLAITKKLHISNAESITSLTDLLIENYLNGLKNSANVAQNNNFTENNRISKMAN